MYEKKIQPVALLVLGTLALLTILSAQKKSVSDTALAADLTQVVNLKSADQSLKKPTYQIVSMYYGSNQTVVCSQSETRFMDDNPGHIATGEKVYWTPALTLPITGRSFFSDAATKKIWNVDPTTGIIGTFTGNYCP